jgi:hypothetical protein
MAEFLDHLRAEIEALERSLEHDPRFVKLRELQHVRGIYESQSGAPPTDSPFPRDVQGRAPHKRSARREMSPATKRVVEAAREYLSGRASPVPLRDLYRELAEVRGIPIGGSEPVNNLSAMLYRYGFEAVGRAGWRLRQQQAEAAPEAGDTEPDKEEPHNSGLVCASKPNGSALGIHGAATL